jgi:hypothetical protein
MKDLNECIEECDNLRSFTCTANAMPPLLWALTEKPQLTSLRMHGGLTMEQANILLDITTLESLSIEKGSWMMMDALPRWADVLGKTLSTLTLYVSICLA